MLALAIDGNFNNDIVRGVLRRKPDANIVRIQDTGLSGADDAVVLEWAAQQGRVLFTHDASTMIHHAYERVRTGKPMPGVFEANREVPRECCLPETNEFGTVRIAAYRGVPMSIANVEEVKRDLSRFLEQVAQGEEVVIASDGNPVAKLVPYQAATAPRVPGYWKGKVRIAADFDLLPREIAAAFRGEAP